MVKAMGALHRMALSWTVEGARYRSNQDNAAIKWMFRAFATFRFRFYQIVEGLNRHDVACRHLPEQTTGPRLDAKWGDQPTRPTMARDEHNKAAEHHENAAKAHRSAAEHHGKGDHAKGKQQADMAKQHSQTAHQHTDQAHAKSQQQK
jgi:hypothetical protein